MKPRQALLREPHMAHILSHFGHSVLAAISDRELAALEAFLAFCAEHQLDDPGAEDIQAFALLRNQDPQALTALRSAFHHLGLGDDFLEAIDAARDAARHKAEHSNFAERNAGSGSKRSVSLPVEELPAAWRKTLRRLEIEGDYAPSTLETIGHRLGLFAWSAQQAGRPVDLGDKDALRAFYKDLEARSIEHQCDQWAKEGFDTAITEPRWATLCTAWNKLLIFAINHGAPDEVVERIRATKEKLSEKERRQPALKLSKALQIGSRSSLLVRAEELLAEANAEKDPQRRHAKRNYAASLALGCGVPARPGDVETHHIFGKGISYKPGRGGDQETGRYRFCYKPNKTRALTGVEIDILLDPFWSKFIDALILQDASPRYLAQLRAKAFEEQRPLYVHYDNDPVHPKYYSKVWAKIVGTGGHIARTLAYDDPTADGVLYGQAACGHVPGSPVVKKYQSASVTKGHYDIAHDVMLKGGAFDDLDLS